MPSERLSKDDRESLLIKLRDGHDLESAGAALGLNKKQIGRLGLYASDFVDRINRYEKSK